MKCRVCGGPMEAGRTDLPFKIAQRSIVILKELPVLECRNCTEYVIEDAVLQQVENLLSRIDSSAELEIIRYAA